MFAQNNFTLRKLLAGFHPRNPATLPIPRVVSLKVVSLTFFFEPFPLDQKVKEISPPHCVLPDTETRPLTRVCKISI